ncbi:MAG: hypothetical protein Tsb005_11770 [Gammaproteobacteria bacterium]
MPLFKSKNKTKPENPSKKLPTNFNNNPLTQSSPSFFVETNNFPTEYQKRRESSSSKTEGGTSSLLSPSTSFEDLKSRSSSFEEIYQISSSSRKSSNAYKSFFEMENTVILFKEFKLSKEKYDKIFETYNYPQLYFTEAKLFNKLFIDLDNETFSEIADYTTEYPRYAIIYHAEKIYNHIMNTNLNNYIYSYEEFYNDFISLIKDVILISEIEESDSQQNVESYFKIPFSAILEKINTPTKSINRRRGSMTLNIDYQKTIQANQILEPLRENKIPEKIEPHTTAINDIIKNIIAYNPIQAEKFIDFFSWNKKQSADIFLKLIVSTVIQYLLLDKDKLIKDNVLKADTKEKKLLINLIDVFKSIDKNYPDLLIKNLLPNIDNIRSNVAKILEEKINFIFPEKYLTEALSNTEASYNVAYLLKYQLLLEISKKCARHMFLELTTNYFDKEIYQVIAKLEDPSKEGHFKKLIASILKQEISKITQESSQEIIQSKMNSMNNTKHVSLYYLLCDAQKYSNEIEKIISYYELKLITYTQAPPKSILKKRSQSEGATTIKAKLMTEKPLNELNVDTGEQNSKPAVTQQINQRSSPKIRAQSMYVPNENLISNFRLHYFNNNSSQTSTLLPPEQETNSSKTSTSKDPARRSQINRSSNRYPTLTRQGGIPVNYSNIKKSDLYNLEASDYPQPDKKDTHDTDKSDFSSFRPT